MEIKSYLLLSIAAIVMIILGMAAGIVAVGLLFRETWVWAVDVYAVVHQGAISLRDYWIFAKSIGAF